MTGWRIGYAGAPAPLIKAMVKLQSQSTSGANSVAQAAAIAALDGPQDFIAANRAVFQARRDRVVAALGQVDGIHCQAPAGAFYAFASCASLIGARTPRGTVIRSSDDWVNWLLDSQDLAVLQGSAYGVDTHFRLSFAASMAQLDEGCRRIEAAAAALIR